MGIADCLFISLISIAWGAFVFAIGQTIRDTTLHDGLGLFIEAIGAIFIAAPIVAGILAISLGIIIAMFHVIKALFVTII